MIFDLVSLLIGFFVGIVVMLIIYTRSRGAAYEVQVAELSQALAAAEASLVASKTEASGAQSELKTADREMKKLQKALEKAEKTAFELETAQGQIMLLESKLAACEAETAKREAEATVPEAVMEEVSTMESAPQPGTLSAAEFSEPVDEGLTMTTSREPKPNDLQLVEGIGPKIADLLIAAGIYDLSDLAEAPLEKLEEVLDAAGSQYQLADPRTWIEQAALGARGEWEAMNALQEKLKGGRAAE